MKSPRIPTVLCSVALLLGLTIAPAGLNANTVTFTGEELLGKPTDTSIAINIVPASEIEYYYQYGTTQGGPYPYSTARMTAAGGQPSEVAITGLSPNTRYFYRLIYDGDGDVDDGDYETRAEHSFWTQRAPGSTFKFTIISDSHGNYNNAQTQRAAANVIADQPDFHFDLGDTFMTDGDTSQDQVNQEYLAQRGQLFLGGIGKSAPVFLASGNHENEEGWNLDDAFSIAQASIQARKLYFPTPIDDGFYSGNTDILPAINTTTYGDQYREDYYAWEWGDALFIVFDPFQYTMANPYGAMAGESNDDPASGDRWNWTLGQQQYNWLKQTLENSNAKYKFMFAHHMLGGTENYVRGGAVPAHMFEWGGYNADGTTWGWDAKRPGWGTDPIRQLMIDNGVSAFFHGHDHQYAYEVRDGIVYQSVPQPNTTLNFSYYSESDPYTERVLSNPGHLRVTVTPSQATVEYITSSDSSGAVRHSYTILPNTPSTDPAISLTSLPLAGFTSQPGTPSAEQSYTISGSNLTDDITITPPADFELSLTSGSGYASFPLILTQSGGDVPETDIYVRFNRSTVGISSGDIVHASSGAATQNVSVRGKAGTTNPVALDGSASSGTADDVSSIDVNHITGTDTDRLMLVGVSWNCGTTDRTISSVTFTPAGGGSIPLSLVKTQQAGTQLRYSAIYSLPDPPNGEAGTVTVTFNGSVSNGIVVGVSNFAGVDQTTPLGASNGAGSDVNSTAPIVTLTGLYGDELVFDNVFQGASDEAQTLTAGIGQTQQWNSWIANVRAAASTEYATGGSVTTSWTAGTASYWAIAAVPINPAPAGPQPLYGDIEPAPGGDCDVDGGDLAAWIAIGGIDLSLFADNFGKNACQ